MKSAVAINLEYLGMRAFCGAVNLLPYPLAMGVGKAVARFLFHVVRFKRSRTLARIRGVFPEKSEREVRRIAYESLRSTVLMGIELILAPKLDRKWMDSHVVEGPRYCDILTQLAAEGHGVVVMVPHSGNYFLSAWAMATYGMRIFAIGSRQRNPKINAWMYRQYGKLEVLDRDSRETLGRIRDRLREGKVFAIQPDLRVRKPDTEVDFLRGKANVSHAGAMYAVHAKAPIAVAAMRREGGKHVFDYLGLLRVDPAATSPREEAKRLTREAFKLLDAEVQKYPGEWFWYNKRWIQEPVAT